MNLFDPDTGEINDLGGCAKCKDAALRVVEAEVELRDCEKELRKLRRQVTKLNNELAGQRFNHPNRRTAEALFRYWIKALGKSDRMVFGEARMKAVLARLEHYPPSYIARAIDGLAVGYYTSDTGMKYDDIELVCRNEPKLEGFYQLAESTGAPTLLGPAWVREFDGRLPEAEQDDAF